MKQAIMVREKILQSKEYLINSDTMEAGREIWYHHDCEPFWNEYYRVGIFDDEKHEEEYEALCEEGQGFYNFSEAYEYYKQLKFELDKTT